MSRYFFDIHADDLSDWDDEGEDCHDSTEVERCVAERLRARLDGQQGSRRVTLAVASVRDRLGNQVLTAMLGARMGLRFIWVKAGSDLGSGHALV